MRTPPNSELNVVDGNTQPPAQAPTAVIMDRFLKQLEAYFHCVQGWPCAWTEVDPITRLPLALSEDPNDSKPGGHRMVHVVYGHRSEDLSIAMTQNMCDAIYADLTRLAPQGTYLYWRRKPELGAGEAGRCAATYPADVQMWGTPTQKVTLRLALDIPHWVQKSSEPASWVAEGTALATIGGLPA